MEKNCKNCILVLGDFMVDHYLWGTVNRISPEAPVPVVHVKTETFNLGGAGNVVNNLLAFGCAVSAGGMVGKDKDGDFILDELRKNNVNTDAFLKKGDYQTIKKCRIIAEHNHVVRFDRETISDISELEEELLLGKLNGKLDQFDCIILSDYGKGLLTNRLCQKIINKCLEMKIPVIVDPKGSDYSKYFGATLVTPNKKEASRAAKIDIIDDESLKSAGIKLLTDLNLDYVVITLSKDGMALFNKNGMEKIPAIARDVYDVTGAGDTVIAGLAYSFSNNISLRHGCEFANKAAAIVVGQVGPATATIKEIEEFNYINNVYPEKIIERRKLGKIVEQYRENSKKIVFTNGCFDIIHAGHVFYLKEARKFGDVLIIGLNSDSSVKILKGESRPIFDQNERASVLSALQMIDHIVIFSEETPQNLIDEIIPDVLVKGGDYVKEEIVGYTTVIENGGQVEVVKFVEGQSTTSVIELINSLNIRKTVDKN
ncbi:D-glycero-beta-D-manno-heptose-7-phosphate kinase [bacterium]|nr:D-glycero-beta-D-manno-heptose-7-phosphate kinase [bacterium]